MAKFVEKCVKFFDGLDKNACAYIAMFNNTNNF